jgi:hypothetical protein
MAEDKPHPRTASDGSEPDFSLPEGMFIEGAKAGEIGVLNVDEIVERMAYTARNDLAFFEGDILLGRRQEFEGPTPRGVVITGPDGGKSFRWPQGEVPYEVSSPALQERVTWAMDHWQTRTPIRFILRIGANSAQYPNYVSFIDDGACYSSVGMQGGRQVISIGPGCSAGSTVHEIGHMLGLWHEQSRADRDQFITVKLENIKPQTLHNFDVHKFDGMMVGQYDYASIMHYPATAFSKNGQPTIVPNLPNVQIGQRNGLSKSDLRSIKAIYPHLDWTNYSVD